MHRNNELKNLIYIQDNKPCNEQTVNGLFRSIFEPVLEKNIESLILLRLEDKSRKKFSGILQRLEFCNAKVYDFSDKPISKKFENILKEQVWEKTEFIYVLSERFGAVLLFDYEESELKDFAQIYLLYNSKILSDSFNLIKKNSTLNLDGYQRKWHPDRRDNGVLNNSIRKIVESLNEKNEEILISELARDCEKNSNDLASRLDFISNKSNYVAHEIRNQHSICNLYSTVIDKQLIKVQFEDKSVEESMKNALNCIQKSLKMANNLLLDLKSLKNCELKEYDLNELVATSFELAKIYADGKNINLINQLSQSTRILVDENKFSAVLINLIKNAVECIGDSYEKIGEITIRAEIGLENVKIIVSNNGELINKELQEKIFEQGFTTKSAGRGLGLAICKKTLEEQFAQLRLRKSDEVSTEFEITILRGGLEGLEV